MVARASFCMPSAVNLVVHLLRQQDVMDMTLSGREHVYGSVPETPAYLELSELPVKQKNPSTEELSLLWCSSSGCPLRHGTHHDCLSLACAL